MLSGLLGMFARKNTGCPVKFEFQIKKTNNFLVPDNTLNNSNLTGQPAFLFVKFGNHILGLRID